MTRTGVEERELTFLFPLLPHVATPDLSKQGSPVGRNRRSVSYLGDIRVNRFFLLLYINWEIDLNNTYGSFILMSMFVEN